MIHALTDADEARIREWFAAIGEQDPATIAELLDRAGRDPRALEYLLEQAAAGRPPWWQPQ